MANPNSLKLELVTSEDIPALIDLWFRVFTDPSMQHLFPDTPGVCEWWTDANRHDLVHKPFQRYLKIIDPDSIDDQGRPRMVAYAKWDLGSLDVRGSRFPPWHEDMPGRDCEQFFGRLDSERRVIMGERKHFYLDMLGTDPAYRRCGAASMLLRWGCDLADQEETAAYVDASRDGAPLYGKFGFVDRTVSAGGTASMVRE
ncbi:hypothetical protein NUU61_003634 [Penicillium alfredii]|uniref:N-acetyltransferase domain-containing protein n=1 Tax=Penicillium alfredii TaxID=1506179 RepID=A0A9W9FJQ8_9EURO|nr:uncharacterized protein NUU61_003634 [Penicillium alfredii]KAJ5101412.1 hypothetical protein NUU61_003634 [Penicillium alfredii]